MILEKGEKGSDVLAWQNFLIAQGYSLQADGHFGEKTANATRFFQARQGLRGDGIVGANTLKAAGALGFALRIEEKRVNVPAAAAVEAFAGTRVERINAARLAELAPVLRQRGRAFLDAARGDGAELQIVQGLRTFEEQDGLYAIGRTKKGKRVTNARGGQSMHNYGLAFDAAPVVGGRVSWDEKLYAPFEKWAAAAGLEWGGLWKFVDMPHLQDDEGMTLAEIQKLYRDGGLEAVWARIK